MISSLPRLSFKHSRPRSGLVVACCTLITIANSARSATNFNWIASSLADYSVASDWDRGSVPNGSINYLANIGNGSTVNFAPPDNVVIGQLNLAPSNNNTGNFHMTGGTLIVSNNNTLTPLYIGGFGSGVSTTPSQGQNSTAVLTIDGGSLTIARNNGGAFYQDGVDLGVSTNASGTLTVNGGTVSLLCGMEIGVFGSGTVNISGGTLIDNSWFGIGRGNAGPFGTGLVNISSGSLYILRNTSSEANATRGFYFCVAGVSGIANISGGSIYCNRVGFANNSSATEIFNMSGGSFYIGSDGVSSASTQPVVNISGGTFHTLSMVPNGSSILFNGNPYTVGNCDTNSILPGGTNWTWSSTPAVNLMTSIPGMGGPGFVTFAPEAGQTITLDNAWNGNGAFVVNGSGTVAMAGGSTYTGNTTVSQGTLTMLNGGSIANSSNIIVAPGAMFAGPAAGSTYSLGTNQTLRNSGAAAILGGSLNSGSGTVLMTYASGAPGFTIVGGTFGLSVASTFTVNNTGGTLAEGRYKLISAGAGGAVVASGALPAVTMTGGGIAGGQFVSLNVASNELYLVASSDRPPVIANFVTNAFYAGATYQIAISNLMQLAGWSDPDGDPVSFSGVGPTSVNGVSVFSDGTNIYYTGTLTTNDSFTYTITDGTLNTDGSVFLNGINPTAEIPSDTNYVVSLNGLWRFYFERTNYNFGTPPNVVLPPATQPFQQVNYVEGAGWTNLPVPGNWEMYGCSPATYYVPDNTCGLYRKWINLPQSWQGRRVYLSLEGVLDGAEIWLNGQPVPVNEASWNISNYHESGWTGFQVDLTGQAIFGTSNLLAIRVIKSPPSNDLDTGDYFFLGGLYRPVTLYSVPQTNIADIQVQAHLLPNNSAEVDLTADVNLGNASTTVSMLLNGVQTDTKATNGQAVFKQIVSQPQLWSSEFPNLYSLTVSMKDGSGNVTESVTNRIGIREITITNGVMLLNGVPVKFAGVCTHDSSAVAGSAVDKDFWRKDILLMKAANVNAIRTTHYPFDKAFYEVCDELGMYVADELPYCWCNNETPAANYQPAFEQRARETLRRDRNHPSVVIWAIGNENSAGNNLQVVADLIKATDATRPRLVSTFNASQYNVELSDAHYPTISQMQSDAANAQSTGHPFIFLENPNTQDERLGADASMWENWGVILQRTWNVCQQYATIPGTFPFEWADRSVADPNSNASYTQYQSTGVQLLYYFPASGIHLLKMKGMIDGFRNPRPNVYEMQNVYSPVQASNVLTVTPGQVSFPIQNRYSFTDLSYLTTQWQLERDGQTIASGSTNYSLAPLTSGTMHLAVPSNALASADSLRVDFIHPATGDVVANQFSLTNTFATTGMTTNIPAALPIPTFNLVTRSIYSNPNYWNECVRYPAALTNLVVSPANATNLAQFKSLTATVIGGTNNSQTLGQLQAQFTSNVLSYTLTWSGPKLDIQEVGWAFTMPTNDYLFSWNRNARWTVYPPNQIGRINGPANPASTNVDATDMTLSNAFDFNSTKYYCNWASLTTATGDGLRLTFSPQQTFQCRASATSTGQGFILYANQQVSPANDISANIIPDFDLTLSSNNVVQGSLTIGSNTNLPAYGAGTLNGRINLLYSSSGGTGANQVQLGFAGGSNLSYSIWASTNLMDWQWEGTASQSTPGQYQFIDPSATNFPARFYRVSAP